MNHTAIVILCGDISRRMSVCKAQLTVNGKRLYEIVRQNLSPLQIPTFIASKIDLHCDNLVMDFFVEDTPLSGILTAMTELHFEEYVFVPVDMPLLTSDMIGPILERSNRDVSAFYTVNGFLQPFPAFLKSDATHLIRKCFLNHCYRLTDVFSHLPSTLIPFEGNLDYFLNINTWEDWHAFRSLCVNRFE
ncbi:molybdenum cofactor guanylyltransferase [Coprothermobacter platensis]|uniref:molybdenum cofactor guanylyltransferase n=1 Tax=Coprothermobacter platensis TaxID=108819 RepID=UPI00036254AE|nr:molybdenum cofactor guanylyltransferase [Coprothermobacter platensis]